jgi:hypothetical protein
MGDMKSKMPDLKELASMTGKLFNDIKTSVGEIIQDYKNNRDQADVTENPAEEVKPKKTSSKATEEAKDEESQNKG